ncbi:MAG: SDR family NAD(P)-dependent oxidoreductase [Rhodospirillaceae bacterium]
MKSVVIGASAGLGRSIAEKLAECGHELYLLSRSGRDLDPLARDLVIRFGVKVRWIELDLVTVNAPALARQLIDEMGSVDNLFLVAGWGSNQDFGPLPDAELRTLIAINYMAEACLANAFLSHLADQPEANLVGIGSVAAVRGRSANMVYGSAKRGLEAYFEALRHYLSGSGCRVQFYRAGFMRTTLLGNQHSVLPAVAPEFVAARIIANLGRDLGLSYVPGWWRWVAIIMRMLPWTIFRRLSI